MYCVECYRADGNATVDALYIFNGKSLCNLHLWEESNGDNVPAVPEKKPARTRGYRLPGGWVPSDESVELMVNELHTSRGALVAEHRKFCDYYYSAPGQKGVKLDWERTWRNWMRNASERGQLRGPALPSRRTNDDKIRELMEMDVAEG